MIRTKFCVRGAIMAMGCAIAFAMTPQAHAITITVNSITKTGDTANFSQNNSGNAGEWQSAVSVLSSGANAADAVGAAVSASTRYASVLGSDSNALNFASRSDSATSNYTVVITVTPDTVATFYDVTIGSSRRGALVAREEGGANANTSIGAVTGTLNAGAQAGLGLAAASLGSTSGTTVSHLNQNSSGVTLTGLQGVQVLTLQFSWTQNTSSGNNVVSGGDESVVLLGLVGPAALIGAADDYPGTSGRSPQSNDGHFLNVTATVTQVPEPGTLAMAVLGAMLLGLTVINRRRIA